MDELDSDLTIGRGGRINSAQFKCEIVDVLPSKIYKQESDTKGGSEFFINSEGSFSYIFGNLLIKKSPHSLTEPEFDRVQISPPDDGVLSLLLQYPSTGNRI